jgi:transposase
MEEGYRRITGCSKLERAPKVTEPAKARSSLNGELSHGKASTEVSREMKLAAVQRMEAGVSAAEVARACEVNPNVLHRWRREFREGPGNALPGLGKRRWAEGQVAELERKIGQQALEIDFLKGCLQRIEEKRMLQALNGKPPSTGKSSSKTKLAR